MLQNLRRRQQNGTIFFDLADKAGCDHRRIIDAADGNRDLAFGNSALAIGKGVAETGCAEKVRLGYKGDLTRRIKNNSAMCGTANTDQAKGVAVGVCVIGQQSARCNRQGLIFHPGKAVCNRHRRLIDLGGNGIAVPNRAIGKDDILQPGFS